MLTPLLKQMEALKFGKVLPGSTWIGTQIVTTLRTPWEGLLKLKCLSRLIVCNIKIWYFKNNHCLLRNHKKNKKNGRTKKSPPAFFFWSEGSRTKITRSRIFHFNIWAKIGGAMHTNGWSPCWMVLWICLTLVCSTKLTLKISVLKQIDATKHVFSASTFLAWIHSCCDAYCIYIINHNQSVQPLVEIEIIL